MKQPTPRRRILLLAAAIAAPAAVVAAALERNAAGTPDDPLIAGFKATYPASVSDAVELVTGRPGTMRHDMKLVTGKPIGRTRRDRARAGPRAAEAGDTRPRDEALGRDDRQRPGRAKSA